MSKKKRFLKLTIGAELRHQVVTSIKIRRGPCDDNRDFKPVCKKSHQVMPLRRGIGDKGYDDEKNHEFLRDELHVDSIIPARYENVPVWRTHGKYRKKMKRGYSNKKYHQRSKDETIFSVIKRVMGENVRSVRGVKAQNNEVRFRLIAYNANRIANLAFSYIIGFLQGLKLGMSSMDTKDLDAYLKANSLALVKYTDSLQLRPTVVTREGDMIVVASSEYRVRDMEMVSRLFESSNDFRYTGSEGGAEHYDWVSQISGEAIAVPGNQSDDDTEIIAVEAFLLEEGGSEFNILGSLTLKTEEGILEVECISDQRLELCKRAVEELLGEFGSHTLDKYTDVESVVSEADEASPTSIGIENLGEAEVRMSLDFFERYHEKWLNTKIKSLGNMTPLEASKTAEGKRNLVEIFKDYENMTAREGQTDDELQRSFLKLRDKLGL